MTALITGAASGMGRLAALRAAAAGHAVAAVDRAGDAVADTVTRSPNSRSYCADVTKPEDITRVFADATNELGPIDQVVHAAGICEIGSALDQPIEAVRRVMEVNYFGSLHLARAVLPDMLAAGRGTLVLFGSLSGWLPSPALAAYSASKSAVAAFSEVLAQELAGSGVRVMCVCPGQIETPLARNIRKIDSSVLGGQRGADPAKVLDAVDRALAGPDCPLFLFPGRMDRYLYRARRFAPALLRDQISRHVRPK